MNAHHRTLLRTLLLFALLPACGPIDEGSGNGEGDDFEVWLVDQSNSFGQTFGGAIHIFDGHDLEGAHASDAVAEVVPLDGAAAALCHASTGANPARPHMMLFNSTGDYGILSFVTSGHVVVFDAPSREPLACFRTELGTGGARQAHAAFPTANDAHIVVANQNGKKLERIASDYGNEAFSQDAAATIDLANCVTPSGAPCQAAGVRPDNAPICPVPLPNGQVIVTLRGGGMFVVDPSTTPMSIVAEYDLDHVAPNGCGGAIVHDTVFITSGGGTTGNLYSYAVYAFPVDGFSAANLPNTPAPVIVESDDADGRDAHGVTPAGGANTKYLWVADRGLGLMTTYDAEELEREHVIEFNDGPDDPNKLTPDLLDVNPSGDRVYASLRGPLPLSGDPHVSVGSQAGLAVFSVSDNGKDGSLTSVVPISNIDALGQDTADGHGIRVRLK